MAKGVHGIIDFTVPAGGSSLAMSVEVGVGIVEARSDLGSINRILKNGWDQSEIFSTHLCKDGMQLTYGINYNGT